MAPMFANSPTGSTSDTLQPHPAPYLGRLSTWQNWIFQRPNAAGKKGALKRYGSPLRPEFDYRRT